MREISVSNKINLQLPKGHKKIIKEMIDRWTACGIREIPYLSDGYSSPECDNVTLTYTNVSNLVGVVREYAYHAGLKDGINMML